ncbi:hypothetical protein JZ751_001747 [Albula glossodonta]|uniref:Uncharacterized protein n=1 Tax=Albula glossodonta TaxID=121402 RepID=A0A8T2PUN7_9TELE|nr:hypothetical protein JZ751_001747 [Albula glossodonta]
MLNAPARIRYQCGAVRVQILCESCWGAGLPDAKPQSDVNPAVYHASTRAQLRTEINLLSERTYLIRLAFRAPESWTPQQISCLKKRCHSSRIQEKQK